MLARIDDAVHAAGFVRANDVAIETSRVEWLLMVARPGKERCAADFLRETGLSAYWPNYAKRVSAGQGRRRTQLFSVIPGYLLLAAYPGYGLDPFDLVNQTPGLVGWVRDGAGRPARLRALDIKEIRRIEADQCIPPPKETQRAFKIGDKVRFADSLLARWPGGRVGALADDGRISVDVPMLGCVVPVWAFAHQIEAM